MKTSINCDEESWISTADTLLEPEETPAIIQRDMLFPSYTILCSSAIVVSIIGLITSWIQVFHPTGLAISITLLLISISWGSTVLCVKRTSDSKFLSQLGQVIAIFMTTFCLLTCALTFIKVTNISWRPDLETLNYYDINLEIDIDGLNMTQLFQERKHFQADHNLTTFHFDANSDIEDTPNILPARKELSTLTPSDQIIEKIEKCLAPSSTHKIQKRLSSDSILKWHVTQTDLALGLITDIGFVANFTAGAPTFGISCKNRLSIDPVSDFWKDPIIDCFRT